MSGCVIGLNSKGEVVSFFGGLFYEMRTENKIYPYIWGVNTYTLPEWRMTTVFPRILDYISENIDILATMGVQEKALKFFIRGLKLYKKGGSNSSNSFDFQKFARFILVLDKRKTNEIVDFIKQDNKRLNELFKNQPMKDSASIIEQVVELTTENIGEYNLRLDDGVVGITTTNRTLEFLKWRILENPFIKYKVFGFVNKKKLLSYIALREEILNPLGYKANRIIDLYGNKKGICTLLSKTIQESIINKHIYIDFSMFGTIYNKELISSGFIKLENDDYCILPQVTTPIENRPNNEYISFFSTKYSAIIASFTKENVYFTRIDSDRDRLGRISQIN